MPRKLRCILMLHLLALPALVLLAPVSAADAEEFHQFSDGIDGFTVVNDQPWSEIGWAGHNQKVSISSCREDPGDELLVRSLPERFDDSDAFHVSASFTGWAGYNERLTPLFVSRAGVERPQWHGASGEANTAWFGFATGFDGGPAELAVGYADASGQRRIDRAVPASLDVTYDLSISYSSGLLALEVRQSGAVLLRASVAASGFAFDVVGMGTYGISYVCYHVGAGEVDDLWIRVDSREPNPAPPPQCAGPTCVETVFRSKHSDLLLPGASGPGVLSLTVERGTLRASAPGAATSPIIPVARINGQPDPSLLNRNAGPVSLDYAYRDSACGAPVCALDIGGSAAGAKIGELWWVTYRILHEGDAWVEVDGLTLIEAS